MNPKKLCVLCLKRRAITTVCRLQVCLPCALRLGLTESNEAEKEFEKEAPPCPKCGVPMKIWGVDFNSDGEKVVRFACVECYEKEQEEVHYG